VDLRVLPLGLLLLASTARAGGTAPPAQEPGALTMLTPGRSQAGVLEVGAAAASCFVLDLPADVVALQLQLSCTLADLDLYANPHAHVDPDGGSRWHGHGDEGEELLVVQRLADEALAGGRVFVCVVYDYEEPPLVDGRPLERVPFTLAARVLTPQVDAELVADEVRRDAVGLDGAGLRTFRVDVPPQASALRLDLFDVSGDLDLFARPGDGGLVVQGPGTAGALNPWGAETLLLTASSDPPLRSGRWTVQVAGLVDPSESVAFALVAGFTAEAPAVACGLPRLDPPAGARGLARALPGVFELFCGPFAGSGTCVTADGWVLTNAHVVATGPGSEVVLCAPLERGLPARESFRGVVAEYDPVRDLALVRITSGFRGEPIPAGYAFPAVPPGDASRLQMGDALSLVGYPTAGGQRSRVTISLSRGVVSGFERDEHGLLLKTDAELQGGSSGGAALDADGLLVGVPTSLVEIGAGQFGFVRPLDTLPPAWRERLGLAR
jgi:hypothetical protein